MPSARRSMLFVPGTRPDRFAKAEAAGADMVCVDLEDAVAPDLKDAAREDAVGWLAAGDGTGPERVVRLNGLKTLAGLKDLQAVAAACPRHGHVFLPKVESAGELAVADAVLSEAGSPAGLIALVESLEGLAQVEAIAAATPRLAALVFGAADFTAELGIEIAPEPLLHARARIVLAAARAGIAALDVPTLDVKNTEATGADAARARAMGFTGKAALHPAQIAPIHAAFTPSPAELEKARRIVAAFEASETGLATLDGKLVERPVVRAAERVLEAARAAGS